MTRNNFTHTRWRGLIRGGPGLAPLFSLGLVLVLCLMPVIGAKAITVCSGDPISCSGNYSSIADAITNSSDGDTIKISADGEHEISSATTGILFEINANVTITGADGGTIIDGDEKGSVFTINSGKTVTIKNVTIQNGSTTYRGGGISNAGTLTVINTTITNCNSRSSKI